MPDPSLNITNAALLVEVNGQLHEVVLPLEDRLALVDRAARGGTLTVSPVRDRILLARKEYL